jgi:trigger factor
MDWQSNVEDIDEITKKISISVAEERVTKEFDASLTRYSRSARINGFRPGKAPKKMVEKMLGDRIRLDVAQKLVDEALKGVFKEHKLDVVGEPEIDLTSVEPSKALEFNAKVSLFPQPVIANYKGRSVKVTKKEVTDKDVKEKIEQLRESKAELKAIESRKDAQKGDVVALSVSIKVGDGEFSRPEPFVDVLGGGKLNPAIEDQFVGLLVGEEREATMVAEADHPNAEIQGKTLVYKGNLHGIFDKKLPDLNDDFVKSLGQGVETVQALEEKTRADLTAEVAEENKGNIQSALLDLLVSEHSFKIPQVMVDDEIREMVSRYGFNRGGDPRSIDVTPFREQFQEFALNRIRCAILVDRIGELEEIKVEEADRDKMIEEVARRNGTTVEAARKSLLDQSRIVSFLLEARRTKILEFLVANTTVEYEAASTAA